MTVSLRPATPADEEFLFAVYAAAREEELAAVPWTPEQRDAFLRMQSAAQLTHYREHYEGAEFLVIERDGDRVGRLFVHRTSAEVRLMDVALMPEERGRGLGTSLVRDLQAEAAKHGVPLVLHVETFNRALRLYERLGFRTACTVGEVYLRMEWRGEPAAAEEAVA